MSEIIWGWRRSSWDEERSRLVYFAADCQYSKDSAELRESRLIVIRRGGELKPLLDQARGVPGARVDVQNDSLCISIGNVTPDDNRRIEKLDKTRRHRAMDLSHTRETAKWLSRLEAIGQEAPHLVVLVGSGLSYEAGIPTLSSMHELFGVDNGPGTEFCLDDADPLVTTLRSKGYRDFEKRVQTFHAACARAQPGESHEHLRRAYVRGRISLMLTDNVDDLFERRLAIPTLKTRGDGLTSETFAKLDAVVNTARSAPHVLLAVGISADRREIIRTLAKSIPAIIINPGLAVSPHSKNLDYLEDLGFNEQGESKFGHVYIKQEARNCLGQVLTLLSG